MAVITARSGLNGPSLATVTIEPSNQVGGGLICGEDLLPGAACYIKQSDGKVYNAGGSGVTAITDEGACIHGFAATKCFVAQNDAVTLLTGLDWGYALAAGMTAGSRLYLDCSAATKGRINTTRPFAGIPVCGFAVTDQIARLYISMPT